MTVATEGPGRGAWSPLPRWATIAILLCLLVGPAAAVLLLKDGDSGRGGGLDAEHLRVARLPTGVAVQGKTLWVASGRDNRIVAVDSEKPSAAPESYRTGPAPIRVAVGAGSVWSANAGNGTVTRLYTDRTGKGAKQIPIGADAVDVAVGPDGAWVSNGQQGTVTRIDAVSNRVLGPPVRTGSFPSALAADENYLGSSTRGTARSPASTRARTSSPAGGSPSEAIPRTS